MQDIVYKLVPGLQEGKCHVLYFFMMQATRDPTNNLWSSIMSVHTMILHLWETNTF